MAHAKVIGIDGKHIETGETSRPLPEPIVLVRDDFKLKVKTLLISLFDNADDALFSMVDKAGTNSDQNLYLEAMRELRLQKKMIANSFLQQTVLSFTNLDHISQTTDLPVENNFENLSLLQKEEVEISVALEGMVSRLRKHCLSQLEDYHQRIVSLLVNKELPSKFLPGGPEVLCEAWDTATESLEIDLKAKLVIFKLFEKYVLAGMSSIYQQANQRLIEQGVLPTLRKQRSITNKATGPILSSSGASDSSEMNQGHYQQTSSKTVPVLGKEQCLTQVQFEQIRSLMHAGDVPLLRTTDQEASSASNVIYLNQDQIISSLTRQQASAELLDDQVSNDYHSIDFKQIIANAFNGSHAQGQTKQVKYDELNNDIINLVSMLFDFILDDKQLQSSMKALIARLQIPMLKVALLDKSFFDRGGHPARKLLNEMASAAIGWNENGSGKADRLKAKIEATVDRVLTEFNSNLEIFEELLHDFTQFTDLELRRGQLIEQRTKDSERGKAAAEIAKKATETLINAVLNSKEFIGQDIPDCVITLLKEGWSRVMILDYLKKGDDSTEWKGHQLFIHDLTWSVCPTADGSDVRAKLMQLIPTLMRRLNQGLQEASFDQFKLSGLLAELEKAHVSALKRLHQEALKEQEQARKEVVESKLVKELVRQEESIESDSTQAELMQSLDVEDEFKEFQERLSVKEINSVLEQHQQQTESLAVSVSLTEEKPEQVDMDVLSDNDPFMLQVSRFAVGCWFEFSENGTPERAKLAAVIKVNGRYIFVNRSGVKVAEKTKQELAQSLKAGHIQQLNDGLLFDRALESIIGNLRGQA